MNVRAQSATEREAMMIPMKPGFMSRSSLGSRLSAPLRRDDNNGTVVAKPTHRTPTGEPDHFRERL